MWLRLPMQVYHTRHTPVTCRPATPSPSNRFSSAVTLTLFHMLARSSTFSLFTECLPRSPLVLTSVSTSAHPPGFDPGDATAELNAASGDCYRALDKLCTQRYPSKADAKAAAAEAVVGLLGAGVDDQKLQGALEAARQEEIEALQVRSARPVRVR